MAQKKLSSADCECDVDPDCEDCPDEFKLFSVGDNVAYKIGYGYSVLSYTNVSGAMVMEAYKTSGMDAVSIDHDHQTFMVASNGQPAPAHGWFVPLHKEDDGLYATQVKWTDSGKQLLGSKSYRYFSPAVETTEDGQITRLHNAALTNVPALQRLKPLVAASVTAPPQQGGNISLEETRMEEILKMLGCTAEEAAEKIKALLVAAGFRQTVLSTLSAVSDSAAVGSLTALKDGHAALVARTAELETQIKGHEQADINRTLDAAVTEGRVPPAKRADVYKLYESIGKEGFTQYLSMLPIMPTQQAPAPAAQTQDIGLSASELEIAKTCGISEKDFAATREKINARRGGK